MTTKNKIKDISIISSGVFWTAYFVKCFLFWELKNPYNWIFNLKENEQLRYFTMLVFFISAIFFLIYVNIMDEWKSESNHVKRGLIIFVIGVLAGISSLNLEI